MYKQIRPLVYKFSDDFQSTPVDYYMLAFPEAWKLSLKQVYAKSIDRPVEKTNLPNKSLNGVIRSLVPDIISIDRYLGGWNGRPWLRSSSKSASSEALRIILYNWAQEALNKVDPVALKPILQQLKADMLHWKKSQIDLADWATHPNGTANKTDEAQFTVLPDYIAMILASSQNSYELKEQTFQLYRVPISPGNSGAELISWPPQQALIGKDDKQKSHYFSILVTITVQTVPFDPQPYIHIDLGVRRWVSQPDSYLRGGSTSVYIKSSVPWIEGIHQLPSFQVASTRWIRNEYDDFEAVWWNYLIDILNHLNPSQTFPTPEQLLKDPTKFISSNAPLNAAIVYRNGIKPTHGVKAGLMPGDRKPLVDQFTAVMMPKFELVDAYDRADKRRFSIQNIFTDKREQARKQHLEEILLEKRHEAIHSTVGNKIAVEIHYQREETKKEFVKQIEELLGVVVGDKLPVEVTPAELTIIIDAIQVGAIGDKLKIDEKKSSHVDRRYTAIDERAELIARDVTKAGAPTICFFEIGDRDNFTLENDPKMAIRRGFARTGRLTQFINRDSDASLSQRVRRCLLDGLRQLGINQLAFNQDVLPMKANYVGLWLIYINKVKNPAGIHQFIPVFTLIEPETHEVYARVPGIEEWMPYRDLLIQIGCGETVKGYDRREQALPFIQQVIEREIVPEGDTILMCVAQNLRRTWTWLRDSDLTLDAINFGQEKPRPITDFEGLRIVRLRNNQSHETPEWYAIDDKNDDKFGFSKGLFSADVGGRRYASTYGKSAQFKKIRIDDSIITRPNAPAWNPAMYELIIAAVQKDDDILDIATTVHLLRDMSVQYDDATAMPLPLHLASLVEEYMLLLNYDDDE